MKISELLELAKGNSIENISKELNVGAKTLRGKLKELDFEYDNSLKEWKFNGSDQTILETSIYDYISPTKPRTKVATNEGTKQIDNEVKKVTSNEVRKVTSNDTNNVGSIERKRFSVDIDKALIKQVKIKSVSEERNIYEMVEEALKDYLNK